jgi:hypothetical protein
VRVTCLTRIHPFFILAAAVKIYKDLKMGLIENLKDTIKSESRIGKLVD